MFCISLESYTILHLDINRNHETIAEVLLRVAPGNTAVLCNGRVVTSLSDVTKDDIVLMETLELRSGAGMCGWEGLLTKIVW